MNVYLEAAQKHFSGPNWGSCKSIAREVSVDAKFSCPEVKKYCDMFRPDGATSDALAWGIDWAGPGVSLYEGDDVIRECRVLALCFAAAMHETGDL